MSIEIVRQALEQRLNALVPQIETAFENQGFTPTPDEPFQEVALLPATPDNNAIGGKFFREIGVFQIALMYPLLVGSADAMARAELIRASFYRGLQLLQAGVTVTIEKTPAIAPGFRDRDRWRLPVSVSYRAEIFS